MTDSATDDTPGDGGLEAGPSLDELFESVAEEPLDERPADRNPTDETSRDERDDQTTRAVFDRLKADETADTDAVLEEDRPAEIIASADEPEPSTDETAIDAALLVDEDALEALLLPDRTEGEEFLWVEAGDTPLEPAADASLTEDRPVEGPEATGETLEESTTVDESATRDSPEEAETEVSSYGSDERAEPGATTGDYDAISGESGTVESASVDSASVETASVEPGPLDLASVESEAASSETSLVAPTESELATTEDADEERPTGILGWLRSKLGLS